MLSCFFLCIVYSCLCTVRAELNYCNRSYISRHGLRWPPLINALKHGRACGCFWAVHCGKSDLIPCPRWSCCWNLDIECSLSGPHGNDVTHSLCWVTDPKHAGPSGRKLGHWERCLWKWYWNLSLFLSLSLLSLPPLSLLSPSHHNGLSCHRPKVTGPGDRGLKLPKP